MNSTTAVDLNVVVISRYRTGLFVSELLDKGLNVIYIYIYANPYHEKNVKKKGSSF